MSKKDLREEILKLVEQYGEENFSKNIDELFIIEEKRSFLETEVKNLLYNIKNMPKVIVGKYDENNN